MRVEKWMKPFAFLGKVLMLYPPLHLGAAFFCREVSPAVMLPALGALLAAALLGWGLAYAARNLPPLARRLLLPPGTVLAAAGAYALCAPGARPLSALAALLAGIAFLLGASLKRRSYDEILSSKSFLFFVCENVAAVAALGLLARAGWTAAGSTGLAASLLAFLLCYAVVRNQSNIDGLMERRRHRLEDLPPKIRAYNLLLTLAALGLLLACFLLRGPIASALIWGAGVMGALLRALITLADWLASLFYREDSGGAIDRPARSELPPMGGAAESSPLWNLLFVLVLGAAVYLLIHNRGAIVRFLRERWHALLTLLRRLLLEDGRAARLRRPAESPYYRDFVEDLSRAADNGEGAPLTGARAARAWRRGLRKFQRMPDGAEKYRFGYSLVLERLRGHGDWPPGNTVGEILQRTRPLVPGEDYPAAADGYERVRYGELPPEAGEMERLSRTLEELARMR